MFIRKQFPYPVRAWPFLAADDGQQAGGEPGSSKTTTADPDEPEGRTFSLDYVRELRAENRRWRQQVADHAARAAAAEAKAEKAAQDAEARIAAAAKAGNDRLIQSELKALAVAAGMVDPDGLKLADLSTVSLDDQGTLKGGAELIEGLKTAKPYLFGAQQASRRDTAHEGKAPAPKDHAPKSALDMTDEEYAAARKAAGLK